MIVDCFPFFQEFDLLDIRLNVLASVVDLFVIVESNYTHSGQPKPYALEERIGEFRDFPILYHQLDHSHLADEPNPWVRENDQRRALKTALDPATLNSDDIIIVSDLDEIPDPAYIDGRTGRFHERCYYFYLNWRSWPWRYGSYMYTAEFLRDKDYEALRGEADAGPGPVFEGVGWHFSAVGTEEEVRRKIESFAHHYEFTPESALFHRSIQHDILGHSIMAIEPIDETFPPYIRDNWRERFPYLVWQP